MNISDTKVRELEATLRALTAHRARLLQQAAEIQMQMQAAAKDLTIATTMRLQLTHPDWSDDRVEAAIVRVLARVLSATPDPDPARQ